MEAGPKETRYGIIWEEKRGEEITLCQHGFDSSAKMAQFRQRVLEKPTLVRVVEEWDFTKTSRSVSDEPQRIG